ncbi:MAG TPA: hypothetical protein VFL27_00175 [Candidatus Dormibacteraeota bacterium]|nr:hypothetical protein [Candidatus Dormibacteraeota bacterium]
MEVPLLLQFCIALFTGMVAATFIPPVRRSIPRPVEVILWIALITVCAVGVVSITDPNARELSASAAWGADQVINTTVGLLFSGFGGWLSDHRFSIASWMVIVAGADIFLLMFIGSWRNGQAWRPRVRLREWMELPVPARAALVRQPVHADALAGVNRRIAAAAVVAGATALARMVDASIWLRDVVVPGGARRLSQAAVVGRVESGARLEGLREVTAHLQYAARAWYAAAGEPAFNELATRASGAMRAARAVRRARLRAGQVVDIQALLNAQSIGWYGPFSAMPAQPFEEGDTDATEQQRPNRLAS